jgi:hypothetical protein
MHILNDVIARVRLNIHAPRVGRTICTEHMTFPCHYSLYSTEQQVFIQHSQGIRHCKSHRDDLTSVGMYVGSMQILYHFISGTWASSDFGAYGVG